MFESDCNREYALRFMTADSWFLRQIVVMLGWFGVLLLYSREIGRVRPFPDGLNESDGLSWGFWVVVAETRS